MTENEKIYSVDAEGPAEIPVNLKLRLEKCPKCGYERQAKDDGYASPFECPQCGVVYALAMEDVRRLNHGQQLQDEAEVHELRTRTEGATSTSAPIRSAGPCSSARRSPGLGSMLSSALAFLP